MNNIIGAKHTPLPQHCLSSNKCKGKPREKTLPETTSQKKAHLSYPIKCLSQWAHHWNESVWKFIFFANSPIPVDPSVVISIEEMNLRSRCPHIRMNPQVLQQSSRPSFFDSDDNSLRQWAFKLAGCGGWGIVCPLNDTSFEPIVVSNNSAQFRCWVLTLMIRKLSECHKDHECWANSNGS